MVLKRLLALLWNTLLVYVAYSICRAAFVLTNWQFYADTDPAQLMSLFGYGLFFDTSAICYTNSIFILLLLMPLKLTETTVYRRMVHCLYVVGNSLFLVTNLIDCSYFPFTGKRSSISVLTEFQNEEFGSMVNIFFNQFISCWYLVLLFVALVYLLYKAWRFPSSTVRSRRESVLGWVLILVSVPLVVGGMRGGYNTATRPITISDANRYVSRPAEAAVVLNTPFCIFRTLDKRTYDIPDYMSADEAAALYSPLHLPADSAEFRPMNVVVLIVESFGKQHFGCFNAHLRDDEPYEGFTPFLDSLIVHGALTWQYSYANGRKSIAAMPSILSSIPNFVEPIFLTSASLNHMSGLARELSENKGYTSAFYHGAKNGSMGFQAFARATGFQTYDGLTEYERDPKYNGYDDFDGTWAIWDEEFLQYYCDRMNELPQPFITSVFTASSHNPFVLPERYEDVFPTGDHPIQECVAYADHALRHFFDSARRQPWFDNTLFVITADHTSGNVDPVYLTTLGLYSVPIIFYSPALPQLRGFDASTVVEQIDIMPTVLGMLGYDRPYIAFGQDIFNTPPADKFAIHWVPELNGYEYVRSGYCLQFDGDSVRAAYRLRDDSLLVNNVLRTMPADTLKLYTRHMKAIIQQYMTRINTDSMTLKTNDLAPKPKKRK